MTDATYIDETLKKIEGALRIHRSKEINLIVERLKTKGILLVKDDASAVRIYRADKDGRKTGSSFLLEGYKRQTQSLLKENEELLQGDLEAEAEKAFDCLVKDEFMKIAVRNYMHDTDMVVIKRTFPEIKPFMTLVEKERKEAKEKKSAEWRRTYETCIELFGDAARG